MNTLRRWLNTYIRRRSVSSAEQFRRTLEKTGANTVRIDGWIVGVYNQDTLNFNRSELKELAISLRKLQQGEKAQR